MREVASFLQHIQELIVLEDGLPKIDSLSTPKRAQFVTEARALDIAEMSSLKADKRYALTVLLVQARLQGHGRYRGDFYQARRPDPTERLIAQFREVLSADQPDGSEPEKLARIHDLSTCVTFAITSDMSRSLRPTPTCIRQTTLATPKLKQA